MATDEDQVSQIRARQDQLSQLIQEIRALHSDHRNAVTQVVMPPPTEGERAVHRVEKYFVAMVVLNICMGGALVMNWITDTNQSYVINAIYMMAPGLQQQIEEKKGTAK